MRPLLIFLILLPHTAIFLYAGISKYRRWQRLDPETRPRFIDFLSREGTPPPTVDRAKWEADKRLG